MNFFNFVELSHFLIDNYVEEGSITADCTSGNGFDTLYLCRKLQGKGFIYSFDVQLEAIERTAKLLYEKCRYNNFRLIKDGHENIDSYIKENIDFAVYNLGFLPNHDSRVKTDPNTTIISIRKVLKLLNKKGIVVITVYTGHDNGNEKKELLKFLEKTDEKSYSVMSINLININKYTPELFIIQKNA